MSKKCFDCKIEISGHLNRKRCEECAAIRLRKPLGTMTEAQKKKAISMIGKYPITEIAKKLGVSVCNIKRSNPGISFWFHNGKHINNAERTKKIIEYYFKHGKPATVKKFPNIKVKSLVDRPEYYGIKRIRRQRQWTDKQKIELIKMAGLVSYKNQARYFKRPLANAGSIKSAFSKRVITVSGGQINGMINNHARHLVNNKCPRIKRILEQRPNTKKRNHQYVCLWVDMERYLKVECPVFAKEAISTLAEFQRKLFQAKDNKDCKKKILKMINERSNL